MLFLKRLVDQTFWMNKVKDFAIETRAVGNVIEKKQNLNIVKGTFKPNNLSSLEVIGGTLELTNQWARDLLKKVRLSSL